MKNIFKQGPISPEFIAESIAKHQHKTEIGAHDLFLGQVRADAHDGSSVSAIEFTAYEQMALEKAHEIREACFERFPLSCLHIHHSLGHVPVGQICLFVFVSGAHRKEVFEAKTYLVERIKKELPIFGKELLEDQRHHWKQNTP